jgi:lipid-binding SYLF domain-containing protein
MCTMKTCAVALTWLLVAAPVFAQLNTEDAELLNEATAVLTEMRNAADSGIPEAIWARSECVVVIPSLKKAGFIVGAESGEGVLSCRQGNSWGPPVFMQLTKGSFGLQAGVQSTQLILVVMNRRGLDTLLSNKVTLGTDASIAAGPVGRTASAATDAQLTAEMLSYSRSKGLFAGIDLSGGTLKPDKDANAQAYGANLSARDLALGPSRVKMSDEARAFTKALDRETRSTTGVK